jgi:hypothetical protein
MNALAKAHAKLTALLGEPLVTCGRTVPEQWIDGTFVYRHDEDGYTCTSVEHDGYPWADRVTGRGCTAARAQMNLFDVLREWNA